MKTRAIGWCAAVVAWAAYALSWFVPTVHFKQGGLFSDLDAGWKAFLITLSMVIKPPKLSWIWALSLLSLLSNALVLLSPWMLRHRRVPVWFASSLAVSFALNLVWYPLLLDTTLLAGYWLWVGSMGLLAGIAAVSLTLRPEIRA